MNFTLHTPIYSAYLLITYYSRKEPNVVTFPHHVFHLEMLLNTSDPNVLLNNVYEKKFEEVFSGHHILAAHLMLTNSCRKFNYIANCVCFFCAMSVCNYRCIGHIHHFWWNSRSWCLYQSAFLIPRKSNNPNKSLGLFSYRAYQWDLYMYD